MEEEIKYETKFENDTEITSYLATAYAEGFCEGEGASYVDMLKAWSYLIGTKIGYKLQGWFGRTMTTLIENNIISEEGVINWDNIEEQ